MSKPRHWWWGHAKKMIRIYPELLGRWEEIKTISITPNYSGMGHGSGISNPTEQVALRLMPEKEQEAFDAVRRAIEETRQQRNGNEKMEMVRLVYWKQSHTLAGAAMKIGYEERTVWDWNGDFIRLVGVYSGFMTRKAYEEIIEKRHKKRKYVEQSQNNGLS